MSPTEIVCAECGATLAAGQVRCWLCQGDPGKGRERVGPAAPNARVGSPLQFSIESLFLVTTLAAVTLGVFLIAPGLGILMAIVAAPALARTMIAGNRKRQAGAPLSAAQKVGSFFLSFALLAAIGYAGCIAFFFVCIGTGLGALAVGAENEAAIAAVFIVSGLVSLSLVGWLIWLTWPKAT